MQNYINNWNKSHFQIRQTHFSTLIEFFWHHIKKKEQKHNIKTNNTLNWKDLDLEGSSREKESTIKHVAYLMSNFFI